MLIHRVYLGLYYKNVSWMFALVSWDFQKTKLSSLASAPWVRVEQSTAEDVGEKM